MSTPEKALAERIRELRRRHFGPRGKEIFARQLGVLLEEYERYERGSVPPGDVMVRMCEATGEDLQWLLTGVAARGTVVISGTRGRHQDLLARLAGMLDTKPELAAPIEAFVGLLERGEEVRQAGALAMPAPTPTELIAIYDGHELPERLPGSESDPEARFWLARPAQLEDVAGRGRAALFTPATQYERETARHVELVTLRNQDGQTREYVRSAPLAHCFPDAIAVRLSDAAMEPMFAAGDAVLVTLGTGARTGRPALCRLVGETSVRCRIWLGEDSAEVHLGRLTGWEHEHVDRTKLCWSLEVLYRLMLAA